MASIIPYSQLSKEQLFFLNKVGNSSQRQLNRIRSFCAVKDSQDILKCVFNIPEPMQVTYYNTNNLNIPEGVAVWQGMAQYNNELIICGTTLPTPTTGQGLIYFGSIDCNNSNPTYKILSVPDASYSSVYGPRNDPSSNNFTFVGSYNNPGDTNTYGFLYRGSTSQVDLDNSANYVLKMNYINPSYRTTFTHSTDGNFAVGNSGDVTGLVTNSWVYNITTRNYTTISYPGSATTTTYGIVKNTDGTYTIAGGYSLSISSTSIENGFVVDMNASGTIFSRWSSFKFGFAFTHFEGISVTSNPNVYSLAADSINTTNIQLGYAALISRVGDRFVETRTVKIDYGKSISTLGITTCNSIQDNNVVGLFSNGAIAFQATINNWY